MLTVSRPSLFPLALVATLSAISQAQAALPGTDIKAYLTANITAKLSLAGTWLPTDTVGVVGPFWNVIKLGASQQEGVALGGWAWNGSFNRTLTDVTPVRAALLEQQSDGTLVDATTRLLGNPTIKGAGSVIVADFNGDALDDLVFPAHNESPFLFQHSTAFISRSGGGFDKLTLDDNVMNHDAKLVTLDGQKKILAQSFGSGGPGFHVIYSWTGNTLTADTSIGDLGGMSVLAGPFTANSDNWLIIGDSVGGPGVPYSPTNPMLIYGYKYNAGVLTTPPVLLPKPYFNDKPAYAGFASFWDPYSKSHTSRLWTTDLNQDGLPDILAGQELWTDGAAGLQKAVFQLLINHGNMVFTDDTDALTPEFSQDAYIDYSVRLEDVDGSGIDTMFHSSHPVFYDTDDATKQGQYILVNDGTGRLYAAMHDEFRAMRTQIVTFLNKNLPQGSGASAAITPQFIAYKTASGALNFVAVVNYYSSTAPNHRYAFVNVPLSINLATDFRRDMTIATRNGSKRIRTFAGNDTISRALTDPDCAIDGGLGTNTAVYPGNRAAWIITRTGDTFTVRPTSGSGGTDTLTRIQSAQFDDQTVNLNALAQDGGGGGMGDTVSMPLRDAIYLYGQSLNSKGDKVLVGVDCDVFQLVTDITSGYTNLAMGQGNTLANAISTQAAYPDKINNTDAMFAYALYQNQPVKTFVFNDLANLASPAHIGTATAFGYCYSAKPTAHVYFQQKDSCTNTYSDGRTTSCLVADNGSGIGTGGYGSLILRDAIYLYGQDFNGKGDKVLAGENCDVFQLILDVNSGYTDLAMAQSSTISSAIAMQSNYPDRINDAAAMFSYALYEDQSVKAFVFKDNNNPSSSTRIGTATAFGYCYSTNPAARVYLREKDNCTDKNSNGQTNTIPGC